MHIYIKDRPNSIHTEEIMFDGSDLVYLRDDAKMDRIAIAAVACVISDERQVGEVERTTKLRTTVVKA